MSCVPISMQCTGISALESFLSQFDNTTEPTYVSVMCCGCGSATIPVAEISHHWNVPQVSKDANKRHAVAARALLVAVIVPSRILV